MEIHMSKNLHLVSIQKKIYECVAALTHRPYI